MLRPFLRTGALAALLGIGCGGPGTAPSAPAPRVLAIAFADSRFNSDPDRGSISTIISRLNGERLVQLGRDGRAEPGLAERWTVSPDGRTWRFTLRRGMTFQDGSPVTATVVRAAILRALAPSRQADPRLLYPAQRDIVRIDAASPTDLVVHLARPNALLLDDLAIVGIDAPGPSPAGPFRLLWQNGDAAELAAFPGYYRGVPALDRIRILRYPSHRMAWSAMLRGEADFVYDVTPDALDSIERSPSTQVATFLRPFVTALVFNLRHPVLRRREVRTALNIAISRTEIIKVALQNRGYPASGHLWPKHWAYDAMAPRFRHDTIEARARLDAAGLPAAMGADRLAPRFSFTCLLAADDPRIERVALLLQRELIEVGVDLRLETVPLNDLGARVRDGRFDAFLNEMVAGHGLNLTYWWWHSTPGNGLARLSYTGADAPLDCVRDARTDADMRGCVAALQQAMFRDPPGAFLYWREGSRAVSRRFVIPRQDDRDIMSSVAQWRLAPPAS